MQSHLSPIIGVGIMLINAQGEVLLGQRIKADETTTWCFPGGKIDQGESFSQAAARELLEETALNIDPQRLNAFCLLNNTSAQRCNSTVGLTVEIQALEGQQIQVTEPHIFSHWKWFAFDQLPAVLFAETGAMLDLWMQKDLAEHWSVYHIKY
ncbi:mutator protein MutT [Acinetobacter calcoaceticus]|uniref:Mutator protein MutT n=1 Tax=Acinetobacter calcoaceticus TaxID=471 RepID=A0A4R1XRS1_ACICA|nr:mutator protein MutT [Acinetobacter calcoaceticus]